MYCHKWLEFTVLRASTEKSYKIFKLHKPKGLDENEDDHYYFINWLSGQRLNNVMQYLKHN
jgi:hypothetical protein